VDALTFVLFAVGAGVGAPLRMVIDAHVQSRIRHPLPVGTLAVNTIGSFVLGVVIALGSQGVVGETTELVIGAGFCGALTTFSTFAYQTVRLVEAGTVGLALATITLNTVVTLTVAGTAYAVVLAVA